MVDTSKDKHLIRSIYNKIQDLHKSKTIILLLTLAAFIFIIYLIYQEWDFLVSFDWKLKWQYLLFAAFIHTVALVLMQYNWHLMMKFFEGNQNWKKNFSAYAVSLASRRIPAPLFYIGERFFLYTNKETNHKSIALSTSLEILLIGLAGFLFFILLLPFYSFIPVNISSELITFFTLIGLSAVIFLPNLYNKLINFLFKTINKDEFEVKLRIKPLLFWLLLYLFVWLLDGIVLHFVSKSLINEAIKLPDTLGISTIAALVGFLSQFIPVGLGLKELTSSALYNRWYPIGVGVVIAISCRILMTVIEFFWAWFWRQLWNNHKSDSNTTKELLE